MTALVTMPDVAQTVVEGTVARWLKQEGDTVEEYEPLVEVVTDKVNIEVPSPVDGVLSKILVLPGTTVPIGAELALVEDGAGGLTSTSAGLPSVAAPDARTAPDLEPVRPAASRSSDGGPGLSPLVRQLADQHGVDATSIRGTGRGGRVRKQDILDLVARRAADQPAAAAASPSPPPSSTGDIDAPLSPVRATIARRMTQSFREVPHAWTSMKADVSGLVALRGASSDRFRQSEGVSLTYLPFFVKATVGALKEYPQVNALWIDDRPVLKKAINISIAVDREEGLVVPVLHDADAKSVAGLARELDGLIVRARDGKLSFDDVQGGTFTLNNTGSFGALVSAPIVNQPQVAILATEAIVKEPTVVGDAIAIRSAMNISISFDHRALDGGLVGRFLRSVKRHLEAYGPDTLVF